MATRTLDVALRIAADLDGAVKDLNALDTSLDGVKGAGQNAAQGLNAASTAAGKNSTAAKAAATAQGALATATQKTADVQKRAALTAGELRAAQRQLPAQITDIVTSLISGQPAYLVAIQQGGQLKDSFGGVGAASRALLGALSPTVLAVGGAAAVFGAIGVAMFQGYQESRAFERGLISTGNSAGLTAGQVGDLANDVGEATGEFGDANTAMLQLAQSGKLTGDSLELAAEAAVNLAKLTGESIEATTEKVISLAEAPSASLLKLNEQYRFLTLEVYDHVRALEEQGRAEDAARAAVEAFASVHEQRVREAEERAGFLERTWKSLGTTIAGIWNGLKDLGRTDTEYKLQAARQALGDAQARAAARGFPFNPARYEAEIKLLERQAEAEKKSARAAADNQRQQGEAVKARESIERQLETVDKRAAKQRELNKLAREYTAIATANPTDSRLTDGSREKLEAAIAAKYADRAAPKGRTRKPGKTEAEQDQEAADRELANLEKQIALLGELEDGERQVSREAQTRYEIENGAFQKSSAASKQQLIEKAKILDALQAEKEAERERQQELEKTKRQYEQLRQELQTPVDATVEDITAKIKVLNETLAAGLPIAGGYDAALKRIFEQAATKPPEFRSPYEGQDDLTGLLGDQSQFDAYNQRLQDWYDQQLAIAKAGREANASQTAYWDTFEKQATAAHFEELAAMQAAQRQMQVNATQSIFDSMASIARSAAGEQSKAYRVMFAISKGFAIAQAAVSMATNIAKASEAGFPQNLPLIAAAIAQGAQIASILAGANYSPAGYATGGRIVGPGTRTSDSIPIMASVDEHMIRAASATQPGARAFLDDFNERGMPALYDWAQVGAYADGGAITEAVEPRARFGTPSASPVNLNNDMALYLYQDAEQLGAAMAKSPAARKQMVAEVIENGQAIRMAWGLG
ncbi:phage tail length tape measure family protein [Thermomonas sp.]|uniref:phage tail length tape measure family protein n=1 Tax=Thermomonas sp. TaxID=1971895 RepID=UPI0035B4C1E4